MDFGPYLAATLRHRDELSAGQITLEAVAAKENLSPKYLAILWETLVGEQPSLPLDDIRALWRQASPQQASAIAAQIRGWQSVLWKFNKIGSYMAPVWQEAVGLNLVESYTAKGRPDLQPGKASVTLYLVAHSLTGDQDSGLAIWQNPHRRGSAAPAGAEGYFTGSRNDAMEPGRRPA